MNEIKYFICPMSKNIVDAVIELNDPRLAFLPSRRQIDFNGGYTGWTTETFAKYVDGRVMIARDHGGIGQGTYHDSGFESFGIDAKYFDLIHVDPWKYHADFDNGMQYTIDAVRYIHNQNPKVKLEIGTEEALRPMTSKQLQTMLEILSMKLPVSVFDSIAYTVIQSGVEIDLTNSANTGNFDVNRLQRDIDICKAFGKLSKEHNGDFLDENQYRTRFKYGLSAINIGPELSSMENEIYLNHMLADDVDKFYKICYESNTWKKWVSPTFDVSNQRAIIKICGHYNYRSFKLPDVSYTIKQAVKDKLQTLLTYVK